MAGFVTHYLFGTQTYKLLKKKEVRQILKNNKHAFCLGLEGPDFFFFHIPESVSKGQNIGTTMHRQNTNKFFAEMINYLADVHGERDYEILYAYIQGFMGHYILDTAIHPYVYSRTGTLKTKKTLGVHYGIETDIDRELLWKFKQMKQAEFSHSGVIAVSSYEKTVIADLLHTAILNTYERDIPASSIKNAITSFYIESALLSDSTELKYKAINGFEKYVFGYDRMSPLLINEVHHSEDPCNLEKKEWHNPWDDTHSDDSSVYEIFDRNAKKYAKFMPVMHEALYSKYHLLDDKSGEILEMLGNNSYKTGLDCDAVEL